MVNNSKSNIKNYLFRKRHTIAAMAIALPLLATPGIAFAVDETPSGEVIPTAITEVSVTSTSDQTPSLMVAAPTSEINDIDTADVTPSAQTQTTEPKQDEAADTANGEPAVSTSPNTTATSIKPIISTNTVPEHAPQNREVHAILSDGLYEIATYSNSHKVIDVTGGSRNNGTAIQTYRSNGSGAQIWRVKHLGDGIYTLQNLRSDKYLDVPSAKAVKGAKIQQYSGNSTRAQQWEIVPDEKRAGYFTLRTHLENSLALDTEMNNITLKLAEGKDSQAFTFEKITAAISNGIYEIYNVNSHKPIEIPGGNQKEDTPISIYAPNNSASQRWRITLAGKDCYTIQNVKTGKYLSANTTRGKLNSVISQRTASYANNQMWKLNPIEDSGMFTVTSILDSTKTLDVTGAKTANGTKLQLYKSNNTLAQYFSLSKIEQCLADGVYELNNLNSHLAIGVKSGSIAQGGNIQQVSAQPDSSHYFYAHYNHEDGYYTFTNVKSGKRLEVQNGSNAKGGNIQQGEVSNAFAQRWSIRTDNNTPGLYGIYSSIGGLALDVRGGSITNGANIQVWTSNNSSAQRWTFKHINQWLNDGAYTIVAANNNNNVLAVTDGDRNDSSAITTQPRKTGSTYQKWYLNWEGNLIKIVNVSTGKALDIRGGKTNNGTIIQQYQSNNSKAQRWLPIMTDSGIMLQSALDARVVIDISGGSKSSGAKIQTYFSNNSLAQRFLFVSSHLFDSGVIYTIYGAAENPSDKPNQVIDIQGGSTKSGARVQMYAANNSPAQRFKLIPVGEDNYRLQNIKSGLFITANPSGILTQTATDNSSTIWLPRWDFDTNSIVLMSSSQLQVMTAANGQLNLTPLAANNPAQGFLFTNTSQQKRLHGIDISGWNADINIARIPADFVIVKATQGTTYENPYFRKHAAETLAAGKLLGLYHFVDTTKGAINEARHFVNSIRGKAGETNYIGKAALFLDWENNDISHQNNINKGPNYAKAFLDEVKRLTGGVKPLIYMSKSVTGNSYNWQSVADAGYGLWMAQYLYKYYDNGVKGHVDNPTLIYNDAEDGQREWSKPTLYQYTSKGQLPNYDKYLDMNVFYGSVSDWNDLAAWH